MSYNSYYFTTTGDKTTFEHKNEMIMNMMGVPMISTGSPAKYCIGIYINQELTLIQFDFVESLSGAEITELITNMHNYVLTDPNFEAQFDH